MQNWSKKMRQKNRTIGFVPTMGYLHEGHLSLMRKARKENDYLVISIFVNPIQFGPEEDFKEYPRDFLRDKKLAADCGVDVIFYPKGKDMYLKEHKTYVNVEGLSGVLCGASRPGHFRGVTTVVLKLFNIVQPDTAYFGQKDAQQAIIIKRMVKDLNIPVIGIGAGPYCDGQILVINDILGLTPFDKKPKFIKEYGNIAENIKDAIINYKNEVENNEFPNLEHSFK